MSRFPVVFWVLAVVSATACDGTSDPTGSSDRRYPAHVDLRQALAGEWVLTGERGGEVPCVPGEPGGAGCPVTWEGRTWERYEARHRTTLTFLGAQGVGEYELDGVRVRTEAIRYRAVGVDSAWLTSGSERTLWHALALDTIVSALAISRAERGAPAPSILLNVPLPMDGSAFMSPDTAALAATGFAPDTLAGTGWHLTRAAASALWWGNGR